MRSMWVRLCAPWMLLASVSLTSAASASNDPEDRTLGPPAVVATLEQGTWRSFGSEFPFTGFKDETAYGDPKLSIPHAIPFTPAYAAKYRQIRQQAFEGRNVLDTGNKCVPLGVPFSSGFGEIQFLFAPNRVVITGDTATGVRIIYTDGKPHLPGPGPSYNGYSVGHWEGNTLVVNTTNLTTDSYIEVGMPHSDAMRVVERWTYDGPDRLINDVEVFDPKAFTRPLRTRFTWKHDPNGQLFEDVCQNNRDVQFNGATTMIGPDGKPLTTPIGATMHK